MDKSSCQIIDLELGAELVGGNIEMAKEMLYHLVVELPEYERELTNAWNKQDRLMLRNVAHKLYGGTCYCGTPRLKEAAKALELHVLGEESEKVLSQSYKSLQQEIKAVIDVSKESELIDCALMN